MRRLVCTVALLALACVEPSVDRPPPALPQSGTLDAGQSADAAGMTGCAAPSVRCGSRCVNPQTDPTHCGDCNQACPGGRACQSGKCAGGGMTMTGCEPPRIICGTDCVDSRSHALHCGGCDSPCTNGSLCDNGQCTRSCSGGLAACGAACVDLESNPEHCGMCARACPADRACMGGSCGCADGYTECSGACIDPDVDVRHCGLCNRACESDEVCSAGSCTCAGGARETDCLDGLDDDCDQLADCEDPDCTGTTKSCMGMCGAGTQTCQGDGTWAACEGGNGSMEICGDGIDQDCDGSDLRNLDSWEPNDTCAQCALLSTDTDPMTTINGRLDSVDDNVDCYKFTVSDDYNFGFREHINLALTNIPTGTDYDLFLYRNRTDCDNNTQLGSSQETGNTNEAIEFAEAFNFDDAGTYYIRVVRYSGYSCTADYALAVDGLN